MEERVIDRDSERKITVKRTQDGETDAVEGEVSEPSPEEELVLEFPDGEYDEDLVGLTPSQLQEELERRKRAEEEAKAECARLVSEGEAALSRKEYAEAEGFFAQAAVYDRENEAANRGLWSARTHELTAWEPLLSERNATEFSQADETTRAFVLGAFGDALRAERTACEEEEGALAPRVEEAQATRREAFRRNRNYYLVRFAALLCLWVALAVGAAIAAGFIYTTRSSAPVIAAAVCGGLALVALGVFFVYCRKLFVAQRLCSENEKLSSTEDGARLAALRERLDALRLVLGE